MLGKSSLFKIVKDHQIGLKLLPNVRELQVKVGKDDELFKLAGITIKEPAKLKFKP